MSTTKWRIDSTTDAGLAGAPIIPDVGVAGGFRVSITPLGGSLDAEFTGVQNVLNRSSRDVLTTRVSFDSGETFHDLHAGTLVTLGSARQERPAPYRIASARERLYNTTLTTKLVTGGDVATMVQNVLGSVTLPQGLTFDSADAPTLGFTSGDRYPQLESLGDFLDGMASLVGRFIVPSGASNYTYDGTTYIQGEIVPAVEWGVKGDGSIYFRRPLGSSTRLEEASARVSVDWSDVSAEDTVDAARVIYADEYNTTYLNYFVLVDNNSGDSEPPNEPAAVPLARLLGTGATKADDVRRERVVRLENALDYMSVLSTSPDNVVAVTNASNSMDGDDSTYAEATAALAQIGLSTNTILSYQQGGILRLVYAAADGLTDLADGNILQVQVSYNTNQTTKALQRYSLPKTAGYREVVLIPILAPVEADFIHQIYITLVMADDVRIYSYELYMPDVDLGTGNASEYYARSFERSPSTEVGVVTYQGYVPPVNQLDLRPEGESSDLELRVDRIEYELSAEDGFRTRLYVGQAYDGDLLSQKAVLERLARDAITRGRA